MKSLSDAKNVAEKENTARRQKFPLMAKKFILGFTAIVIIVFGTYYWKQYQQLQKTIVSEKQSAAAEVICPDASANETRSCIIGTEWSNRIKFEDPAFNGMQVCATPGGEYERTEENGTTFWRFKTKEGRLVKTYRLYPASQKCPGTLPG